MKMSPSEQVIYISGKYDSTKIADHILEMSGLI